MIENTGLTAALSEVCRILLFHFDSGVLKRRSFGTHSTEGRGEARWCDWNALLKLRLQDIIIRHVIIIIIFTLGRYVPEGV